MNIIMIAPEAAPYSKTGGLADVTGALHKELTRRGHRVKVFSPLYRCVRDGGYGITDSGLSARVKIGGNLYKARVFRDGDFYFIDEEDFFCRDELYGRGSKDYDDNPLRFAFFSMAALESARKMGERIDIVHCHDWQTGLVPIFLKERYSDDEMLGRAATVFTIHNLAYQGLFPPQTMDELGLSRDLFNMHELEFYGKLSFIKGGLVFSDLLTTVSRKYSREIQEAVTGCGLEGLLRKREKDLAGIVNGIDFDDWDPATDSLIPANYSSSDLSGKRECKKALKKTFGLPDTGDIPLVGMISRLDPQKGFEIIEGAERALMKLPVQMIFLGSGSKEIQSYLEGLAGRYPQKVAVSIGYNESLAHMIEAGSDIYLMPSKYEPCGLNHLYSLKYGTIPVVRATGGLDDAIISYNGKRGNGFKFRAFSSGAMIKALKKAVRLYMEEKKEWAGLQKKVMEEDHSWEKSVKSYETLYRRAIKKKASK